MTRIANWALAAIFFLGFLEKSDGETALTHEALFAPKPDYPYFQNRYPFNSDSETFDAAKATFLAESSLLIYVKDNKRIESILETAGAREIRFFDEGGTFAFLATMDQAMVLVFRGTETGDQIDYLTDAKIIKKPFGTLGRAHSGFVDALDLVREDVNQTIKSIDPQNKLTLWMGGHSLGGALATLYALQCDREVNGVYTIGAPRVGNKRLAKSGSRLKLYRIVHDNDIIARLPSPPFYFHFGTMHFITSEGKLIKDPEQKKKWESRRKGHLLYLENVFQRHWANGEFNAIPIDYFADHSPLLYAKSLKSILENKL